MNQLELHKKIEKFFKAGVALADIKVAQSLLINDDSKRFFFSQADGSWIAWLWENGFLNEIKSKAKDPTRISYRLPELDYLTRMAGNSPTMVTKIMLDEGTATKEGNLNPEVVDRFLWITSILPAEQSKLLATKIRRENWVYLMRAFRKTGYEFEKIITKLVEGREDDAILELAEAIFIIKSKSEIKEGKTGSGIDDPFYITDIAASGIFEALADIQDSHRENALKISAGIMGKIVKLAEPDETKVFDYMDLFSLYDVDFFTLEIEGKRGYSYREDIKNLAATIKKLIRKTIGEKCSDGSEAKRIFEYINTLPSCRSMWRLRLFALAQCPKVFNNELKEAFFRLFTVDNYYEIEGGAEYKKALKIGFPYLSDIDRREYVKNVLLYFSEKSKKDPDRAWIKRTGLEILSSISQELLEEDEKVDCKKYFGKRPDPKYEPEPFVRMGEFGVVKPRSPINPDNFTINQIIANLKSEWTTEKLNEEFKNDPILSPRGVEGLGDALKEDIKKRTGEYLDNINSFFDRGAIHPHYVYSLLRGIEEMFRNKQPFSLGEVSRILGLFEIIQNEGIKNPFERHKDDTTWLTDWVEVHKIVTDILLSILGSNDIKDVVHKKHRKQIKNLISYLFTIADSPSKECETSESSEPYSVAINSVRGRAYEAFVVFTENDGNKLADDIKEIYKKVLLDDSLAVRFVVGRYLASFYFRDKKFAVDLFSEIFPKDNPAKKDLYLASWEGYLSNTLYDKLFFELEDYYSHAITLDSKNYTQRKYSKGLDESLAIHIALGFIYLGLEIGDPLFVQFWDALNTKRHYEFISFIGRNCLTRDQAGEEWFVKNKVSKKKLLEFWDWAIEYVVEPEVFAGFGFWVNPTREVLADTIIVEKVAQTLRRSGGNLDWDYGLLRRLPIFARVNAEKTLDIIWYFLLDSENNLNQNRHAPFIHDSEIKDALKIIYSNGSVDIQQKIVDLVNFLIEKGGSMFWDLKEVIRDNM